MAKVVKMSDKDTIDICAVYTIYDGWPIRAKLSCITGEQMSYYTYSSVKVTRSVAIVSWQLY